MIKYFLNPEGHQNPIRGPKVTVILLKVGFGLLVDVHREGSAPAACAAGLIRYFSILCFYFHYKVLKVKKNLRKKCQSHLIEPAC